MRCALVLWVVVVLTASARGDHLPARVYTTADGLANNRVDRCTHDTHGFLWFATEEGVSRFDGQRFESLGVADGLPAATTHDVLATRDGRVWAATDAGVAVLDTRERVVRARFRAVTADAAFALFEDPTGVVWAGTAAGLARIDHDRVTPIAIKPVLAIAYDAADRSLWLGTSSGLVHRTADGQLTHIRVAPAGILDDRVPSLLVDREHRLWVGAISLHIIVAPLPLATPPEGVTLWDAAEHAPGTIRLEPDGGVRRGIYQDPKGTIWIGTTMHLHRWDGHALEIVRNDPLESFIGLSPCVVDSGGNLWLGTDTRGVVRVAPGGLVSYDTRDGLDAPGVYAFVEEPGGPVHVITWRDGHVIARHDGDRFVAVRPHAPAGVTIMAWGWNQTVIIDRDHRWWYPTAQGVLRFPRVATTDELATAEPRLYGVADGLPGRDVFRIYEDHRGDVWISTLSATGLARWDRATDRITVPLGFPHDEAAAFAEDHSGALWIGYTGTVVRVRDGVPEVFGAADGIPAGGIGALLVDRAGRLWIASADEGVARIDDPTAAHPRVRHYRASDGLGSDRAMALVDDLEGRIYIGTTRGVARLDPATGTIGHYGADEGLPNDYVHTALRDRTGALWFGTKTGAARFVPGADRVAAVAPVYVTRVVAGGVPRAIAAGGERAIGSLELDHDGASLDVEFTSPRFEVGDPVRYQYRLDGAWSAPVAEHAVHLARLAPGSYRFEVRTIDGGVPATIAFVVLPPIWQRWWFIGAAAIVVAAALYLAYRWRLAHMLAVERVRTRIATDLHDELGSSLSRIAILSELASRRSPPREGAADHVEQIGTNARELVDVAADIVWSTDPKRDDLGSLLVRLRSFAGDVLEGRGIAWSLEAPPDPARIKLEPDRRRHLYLVLKEAIHNAAKHSAAMRVEIAIRQDRGIVGIVRDDGRGFDEAALERRGNGLANMRARAEEAGGTLAIRSRPGGGTEIELRVA